MNPARIITAAILIPLAAHANALAQNATSDPTQNPVISDETPQAIRTTGFVIPAIPDAVRREYGTGQLVVTEVSRVTRRANAEGADLQPIPWDADAPFLRLAHSVTPAVAESLADFNDVLRQDAQQLAQALGASLGDESEVTRAIAGADRTGTRIAAIGADGEPVGAFEIYTFADNLEGVGVIIKTRDDDQDEDRILSNTLPNIEVLPVSPDTAMTFPIGGYPLTLPAAHVVSRYDQPNQQAVNATIKLVNSELQVQVASAGTPQRARDYIFNRVIDDFAEVIRNDAVTGGGEILWELPTARPLGPSFALGRAFGVKRPDGEDFILEFFAFNDGPAVVSLSFSYQQQHRDAADAHMTRLFNGANAQRPLADLVTTWYGDAFRIGVPALTPPLFDESEDADRTSLLYSTEELGDSIDYAAALAAAAASERPIFRIDAFDHETTPEAAHERIIAELRGAAGETEGDAMSTTGQRIAAPGQGVLETTRSDIVIADKPLVVRTIHIGDADGRAVHLSAVTPPQIITDIDALLGAAASSAELTTRPPAIDLDFAWLSPDADAWRISALRSGPEAVTFLRREGVDIAIRRSPRDPNAETPAQAALDLRWKQDTAEWGGGEAPVNVAETTLADQTALKASSEFTREDGATRTFSIHALATPNAVHTITAAWNTPEQQEIVEDLLKSFEAKDD